MKLRTRSVSALFAFLAVCLAAGCGQKGPLYHPGDKPPVRAPAKPPAQSGTDSDAKRQAQ